MPCAGTWLLAPLLARVRTDWPVFSALLVPWWVGSVVHLLECSAMFDLTQPAWRSVDVGMPDFALCGLSAAPSLEWTVKLMLIISSLP